MGDANEKLNLDFEKLNLNDDKILKNVYRSVCNTNGKYLAF